ncbi:hypothetical protein BKA67DRAFT_662697 [Truncatella angustata]|uniref:Arf-GAP domain-containing protein n=1 Tax=Truncatella angustata TaxID=152316 RepID=A0A9P8RL93_9PEZI|nr:uncharacterized protein BKA67DRAFT_662697 [Truncatella angustata]KAH6647954.1 hypothetical protein BKA67DRAFT_662697 [Truncatella angustata]KAH8203661.1 hypothetical protein TruAng_002191 [Truncatella angustata]
MSRRPPPNPAAERAAQNQATLKSLLKLEPNKVCSDCKKNKHPRWASWNLGIFVCIRCSGIHRSMGTHISRVKSVDLDSWTDEQLQSILSWGNARANKYWEAKLAPGHVPSEAKIENFIRTKYELKRWVMDGPKPDPATLDVDGDDDIPLSIVKEKQNIERKESLRKQSVGQSSAPRRAPAPQGDLIGGDDLPPRASTAGPSSAQQVPPRAAPAPPKATAAKDSLFGLDFLSDAPAAPPRPASTTGTAAGNGGQSRPDLKQSILSLYASAPRPQPPQGHQSTASFGSFGGMTSPSMQSPTYGHQSKPSAGGGLNDAFAGLSFGNLSSPTPKSPPKDAFAGLGGFPSNKSTPQPQSSSTFSNLSGGSFFDTKPARPAAPQQQQKPSATSSFDGFGDWGAPAAPATPAQPSSSSMGDLFDLSSPAPVPQPAAAPPKAAPAPVDSSVFNLSQPKPAQQAPAPAASVNTSGFGGADVWGNAWGEPAAPAAPAQKSPEANKPSAFGGADFGGGWGGSTGGSFANTPIVPGQSGFSAQSSFSMAPAPAPAPPKVAADEEFGGWASSATPANTNTSTTKQGSGFGNDDLFSNVWQ